MATRFYFPLTTAADVTPPAALAAWEHNNNVNRRMEITVDNSTLTNTAYTPDAADDLTNKDAMHRQYVSKPLAAQTISGNIKGQLQCLESNAADNLFLTLAVRVISQDGTTVRNESLGVTRATSLEVATVLTNRTFPSTSIGSFACAAGDRLLVEIGLAGTCTAAGGTQGHNGSIRWGTNAAGGDLAIDETSTGTTLRGWIEFSNTLTFQSFQTLTATAIGVAVLSKVSTFLKSLSTTAVGITTLTTAKLFAVLMNAVAVGTATLAEVVIFVKSLNATAIGVSTLSRVATYFRTLTATSIGLTALSRIVTYLRTLDAVAVGASSLSRIATYFRSLNAVDVGVVSLAKSTLFNISVAATSIGVSVLQRSSLFFRTLDSAVVGIVDAVANFIAGGFSQTLAIVAVGVVDISAVYIPGGGGGSEASGTTMAPIMELLIVTRPVY